jgi:hypothetical protein
MSLLVVSAFVIVYVVLVVFVLALLRASSQADEAAERDHRALVRSMSAPVPPRFEREDEREPEIVVRRRVR